MGRASPRKDQSDALIVADVLKRWLRKEGIWRGQGTAGAVPGGVQFEQSPSPLTDDSRSELWRCCRRRRRRSVVCGHPAWTEMGFVGTEAVRRSRARK